MNIRLLLIAFIAFFLQSQQSKATHALATELNYTCVGPNSYLVELKQHRDCNGINIANAVILNAYSASCGINTTFILNRTNITELDILCPSTLSACNGGSTIGIEEHTFIGLVSGLAQCNDWVLSYSLCCLSTSITNMLNPNSQQNYLFATLDNTNNNCNNTPSFPNSDPVIFTCINEPTVLYQNVIDLDGDSVSIALVTPLGASGNPLPFAPPFSATYPLSTSSGTFQFTTEGTMTFTPNAAQNAIIGMEVSEFRNGQLVSTSHRWFNVVVTACSSSSPTIGGPTNTGPEYLGNNNFQFCGNGIISFDIALSDVDPGQTVTAFLNGFGPNVTLTPLTTTSPFIYNVVWDANGMASGNYTLGVEAQDNGCPILLSSFENYNIELLNPSVSLPISATSSGNDIIVTWSQTYVSGVVYTISLDGSVVGTVSNQGSFTIPGLVLNTSYDISVEASNGSCVVSNTITHVLNPNCNGLQVTTTATDQSCFYLVDGSASVNISGGIAPYNTVWSTGAVGAAINALSSGSYTVTVTDANLCTATATATVGSPSQLIVDAGADVTTPVGNTVSLNGIANGGVPPYTYEWVPATGVADPTSPVTTFSSVNPANTLQLAVVDATGCMGTDYVVINFDNPLPDTIHYLVAPDGTLAIDLTTVTNLAGSFSAWSIYCSGSGVVTPIFSSPNLVYTAGSTAGISDTLCLTVSDVYGYGQDITVIIDVESCVWPGDADNDATVTIYDVLMVGLGYGNTDQARPNATSNWQCEPMYDWASSAPLGTNFKHTDTNGDGTVDVADLIPIATNFGQLHLRPASALGPIPFYISPATTAPTETIELPVILGDALEMANDVYGIAFTITYDPALIEPNTVSMSFNNSWFGSIGSDMIELHIDDYGNGKMDVGLTRIDGMNVSGYGQIGELHMTIKDDILRSNLVTLTLDISNVRLIDNNETVSGTIESPGIVSINTTGTSTNNVVIDNSVLMSPNPTSDRVQVSSVSSEILSIAIYDIAGRVIILEDNINASAFSLDLKGQAAGIYFVKTLTDKGHSIKKLSIKE